jgi:hypothetical protein
LTMPTRCLTKFVCEHCRRNISLQKGDENKYLSLKCDCRIVIIYPSGIISEIDRSKYKKDYGSKHI